jgi:hypothetical protein
MSQQQPPPDGGTPVRAGAVAGSSASVRESPASPIPASTSSTGSNPDSADLAARDTAAVSLAQLLQQSSPERVARVSAVPESLAPLQTNALASPTNMPQQTFSPVGYSPYVAYPPPYNTGYVPYPPSYGSAPYPPYPAPYAAPPYNPAAYAAQQAAYAAHAHAASALQMQQQQAAAAQQHAAAVQHAAASGAAAAAAYPPLYPGVPYGQRAPPLFHEHGQRAPPLFPFSPQAYPTMDPTLAAMYAYAPIMTQAQHQAFLSQLALAHPNMRFAGNASCHQVRL